MNNFWSLYIPVLTAVCEVQIVTKNPGSAVKRHSSVRVHLFTCSANILILYILVTWRKSENVGDEINYTYIVAANSILQNSLIKKNMN